MQIKKSLSYSVILSFFLTSCASYIPENSAFREPSSAAIATDDESFELSFEVMMRSPDAAKIFLGQLDQVQSIFLRTEASLADYDEELNHVVKDAPGDSFGNSKSYKKMMVMWRIQHHLRDKIVYNYLALLKISEDQNISSEKRNLAQALLSKFDKKLNYKDALAKVAYDDIKIDLTESKDKMKGINNKSTSLNDITLSNLSEDQEKLELLRDNRKKFRKIGKLVELRNDELNQQIEKESDNLQLVDQVGREPQQANLKYYPSNGTNGNVVGLIFPKNVWALTYDDGPNPNYTPTVVKNLKELGIKATFFWLAENVIQYPSIVNLVKGHGHELENHSWTHVQLTKVGPKRLQKEIVDSTLVEAKAYGEKPKFFRCPYGAGTNVANIRNIITEQGMIHVFWNVDTLDWHDRDPDSILERAKKQMLAAGHGVVLFHDVHPQSVIASKKLVQWTKSLKGEENKIRWVTIPEIVNELNGVRN